MHGGGKHNTSARRPQGFTARMRSFWTRFVWNGFEDDAGRPRPVPISKQPRTITLPRVDPARWNALCADIRAGLEPRLVDVGEKLTASELSLRNGEEQVAREYLLALDAYAAAGKLLDEADAPAELGGVSALLDIAATHFAVATARHDGRPAPHRKSRCFYNPLHGAASSGADASRKPKKRQRQNSPWGKGTPVPMCADCRHRAQENLPLDVLPIAVSIRVRRRTQALVALPYYAAPKEQSVWAATGYGSLPGSSDADLVRRVLRGDYREQMKGSDKAMRAAKRK